MLPPRSRMLTIGVTYLSIGSLTETEAMSQAPTNLMTGPKGGSILKQRANPADDPFGNSNPAKKMQHQMKRIAREHVALNQRMSKAEQDRSEAIETCDRAVRELCKERREFREAKTAMALEITILKGKLAEASKKKPAKKPTKPKE